MTCREIIAFCSQIHTKHKYTMGRMHDLWILNLVVYRFTTGPRRIKVMDWARGIPFRREVCRISTSVSCRQKSHSRLVWLYQQVARLFEKFHDFIGPGSSLPYLHESCQLNPIATRLLRCILTSIRCLVFPMILVLPPQVFWLNFWRSSASWWYNNNNNNNTCKIGFHFGTFA